jgi:glycosyltransferase involved in cell wall biosynthesis
MRETQRPFGDLDRPAVDIGMPTRGGSVYIAEAIETILAQTFTNWRLLISENGAGEEGVRRVLEPYLDDPRVEHVVVGSLVGVGPNHTNATRGKAPYISVLHDDDRWHPEFLERRVRFLEEHDTCGFVYSGQIVIDELGQPIGRTKPKLPPGVHTSAEVVPRLFQHYFIGVPTTMMRRAAYDEVGPFFRDLAYCDHELWLRFASRFDVGCLGVWDAEYRVHTQQFSAGRAGLAKEQFQAWDALPDLPISHTLRRRAYAEAHVRCALDAVELGDAREAIRQLGRAVQTSPSSIVRPTTAGRMVTTLAALAGREPGRRVLTHWRSERWRTGGAEGLLPPPDVAPEAAERTNASPQIYVVSILRPKGPLGVQTHINSFLRYAAQRRQHATLVTPFDAPSWQLYPILGFRRPLERVSGTLGVRWYRRWHGFLLERTLSPLLAQADEHAVIYAHCPVSADAALRARRSDAQAVVMAVHYNVSQADEWYLKGMIEKRSSTYDEIMAHEHDVLSRVDGVVYMSEFMEDQAAERVAALRHVRSAVVPNFVSLPPGVAAPEHKRDLLCVGSLEPRKNQRYLLEILAEAERLGHAYSLTLVGEGPDRRELEDLVQLLGLSERTRFLGVQPTVLREMRAHRAVCLTSRIDNFPLVLLEAMGLGVPVISTRVGGIPEMLTDGVEGVYWPLDDATEAARILIGLLEDEEALAAMGQAGIETVRASFTAESAGDRLLTFLTAAGRPAEVA